MKLRRQLFLGYILVFLLMGIIAVVNYFGVNSLMDTSHWVAHTHEVMAKANFIKKLLIDMETGLRGFIITANEDFLEPYENGNRDYITTIDDLKKQVSDNPAQVKRLEHINTLVVQWQETIGAVGVAMRRQQTRGEIEDGTVESWVKQAVGKQTMDTLRKELDEFVEVENGLLAVRDKEADKETFWNLLSVIAGTALAILIGVFAATIITRSILRQVGGEPADISALTQEVAEGNLDAEILGDPKQFSGILSSVSMMLDSLKTNRDRVAKQDWLKTGLSRLNDALRGDLELSELSRLAVSEVVSYLDAKVGAFYVLAQDRDPEVKGDEKGILKMTGSYAYKKRKSVSNEFRLGEGLAGQVVLEKQRIMVSNVPEDYMQISSTLVEGTPKFVCVSPYMVGDVVKGVMEIGSVKEISDLELEYLDQALSIIAIAVQVSQNREELDRALQESQTLSEELQAQQEELRASNEELEEKSDELQAQQEELKASNEELEEKSNELQVQQEELRASNEELEEKTEELEKQRLRLVQQNQDLELARTEIMRKADELEISGKYKSEFLANMSHELRTPLNAILLLSRDLADNPAGNLDGEQVEAAEIVNRSGNDLLQLINDILDLSKIEAGKMHLEVQDVEVGGLVEDVKSLFAKMAQDKGLLFTSTIDDDVPKVIRSDSQRLSQILKNFISNAMKFTSEGEISIAVSMPTKESGFVPLRGNREDYIQIAVADTGIGVSPEQQLKIFEAFQQADGSTSRKYGGTGLGLTISRELAKFIHGEIVLKSEQGKGSEFSLFLPMDAQHEAEEDDTEPVVMPEPVKIPVMTPPTNRIEPGTITSIKDDRDTIADGDQVLLIIDDDDNYVKLLAKHAKTKGFKFLAVATGEDGLLLAAERNPNAILLDIGLPGIDGWEVLEKLKENPELRHIPVHIISAADDIGSSLSKGVFGVLQKPVEKGKLLSALANLNEFVRKKKRSLLVVEDDKAQRKAVQKLIGDEGVEFLEAETGEDGLRLLTERGIDCVVLDLGLPDMTGFEFLKRLEGLLECIPPVIVFTGKDLTADEQKKLNEFSDAIILKGVKSEERLLDETALFLHRAIKDMPERKRKMIADLHDKGSILKERKVLIVDDDMRNLFALTRLLAAKGMVVSKADNGLKALDVLKQDSGIEIILMDIMMPEMDGYEAMRAIRDLKTKGISNHDIPIIAITAKAMKEDRQKCIDAGASDYLAKPVDQDKLFSMLRVWLY